MNKMFTNEQMVNLSDAQGSGFQSVDKIPCSIHSECTFQKTYHATKIAAFTLIEMIITLTIFSIVIMLALPSFSNMLQNGRLSASTNGLASALNLARSTALNQSMNVQVCPIGALGSTTCGNNWSTGWIVVTLPTTGGSVLLKSQQYASTDPTLTSTAATVTFDAHGLATTQSNFKLCDNRGGTYALSVQVIATGYVQSGSTPGQAVWDNSALSCP